MLPHELPIGVLRYTQPGGQLAGQLGGQLGEKEEDVQLETNSHVQYLFQVVCWFTSLLGWA